MHGLHVRLAWHDLMVSKVPLRRLMVASSSAIRKSALNGALFLYLLPLLKSTKQPVLVTHCSFCLRRL
jgi:hypothetical protein